MKNPNKPPISPITAKRIIFLNRRRIKDILSNVFEFREKLFSNNHTANKKIQTTKRPKYCNEKIREVASQMLRHNVKKEYVKECKYI